MRKPVFWVSDQVRHKPGREVTEDAKRLKISDLGRRAIDSTLCEAKTKALISCVFVFAYAKSWFSHNEAHIKGLFMSL